MSKCSCHVREEVEELGYVYVMCTLHYDEFVEILDRPARELPSLSHLFRDGEHDV